MASDALGVDFDMVDDIDPHFRLTFGRANLENALLRRISTEAGSLESIGGDPNYGYDLPGQLLREVADGSALSAINSAVQAEIAKDPRVQFATARTISSPGE